MSPEFRFEGGPLSPEEIGRLTQALSGASRVYGLLICLAPDEPLPDIVDLPRLTPTDYSPQETHSPDREVPERLAALHQTLNAIATEGGKPGRFVTNQDGIAKERTFAEELHGPNALRLLLPLQRESVLKITVLNALARAGFHTTNDLRKAREEDLLTIRRVNMRGKTGRIVAALLDYARAVQPSAE